MPDQHPGPEAGCVTFPDGPSRGWYQLAFAREVPDGVSPWRVGPRRLILVREGECIRAFDGDCPHRGADLGQGGRLDGDAVICPFHRYRIGLGQRGGLCVAEHPVAVIGGMVLVLLGGQPAGDLVETLAALVARSVFAEALTIRVAAPMTLVIENAFDFRHFFGVHNVEMTDGAAFERPEGGLGARATLMAPYQRTPEGTWVAGPTPTPYDCIAFSPGLTLVQLGGLDPYGVITGACDRGDGTCEVRLTFALPRDSWGDAPAPERLKPLIDYSRTGLEADRTVWESIRPDTVPHWVGEDAAVRTWHAFCRTFA
ncbi:MAG: Rieske 2Fe-2S domain-containing protein [Alphaproteobacteria bacterium]|jgi:nitrite reductase/ring-hydroxylating ferredoxin subunit|nr:Rieske 2Fe-2S domain-containing protein [Alphaproteobacteria bacterium]